MKTFFAAFFSLAILASVVFVGESTASAVSAMSSNEQVNYIKRKTRKVAHRTKRSSKYAARKTVRGTRWTAHKTKRGTKAGYSKTKRVTKRTYSKTKDAVQ